MKTLRFILPLVWCWWCAFPNIGGNEPWLVAAFASSSSTSTVHSLSSAFVPHSFRVEPKTGLKASLGDFTVDLKRTLGIVLQERSAGGGSGVQVKEIRPSGSAASSRIVPGDVVLQVDGTNVEEADFDTVMDLIISASSSLVSLTMGDGLGTFNMPKNVVNMLKSKEDAFFVDAVVREAVREIRRNGRLGDLLKVEVIVGAGVRENGTVGMVRFFAIFSTDGVSTYSCNVAAKGIRQEDGSIRIVSLSCAKDEGLGQTYDLIQEEKV